MRPYIKPLVLLVVLLEGCSPKIQNASLVIGNGAELQIQLVATHKLPAEHERKVVLVKPDVYKVSKELYPDTGGYSATNVYKCSASEYMLKGYFDTWSVNTLQGTIKPGPCTNPVYEGVFEGVGNNGSWRFYRSNEKPERLLQPSGG